jgi:hypothetical protein
VAQQHSENTTSNRVMGAVLRVAKAGRTVAFVIGKNGMKVG